MQLAVGRSQWTEDIKGIRKRNKKSFISAYGRGFYLGLRVQGWLLLTKGWLMMIMWEKYFLSYVWCVQRTFLPFCAIFFQLRTTTSNCFVWSKNIKGIFLVKGIEDEKLSHQYRLQRVKFTLTHLDTTTPIHPFFHSFLLLIHPFDFNSC